MTEVVPALLTGLLIPGMYMLLKHYISAQERLATAQTIATNSFKNTLDETRDLIKKDIDRLYIELSRCQGQLVEFQKTARDLYARVDDCNQKCNKIISQLEKLTKLDAEHVGEDAFRVREKKTK